MEIKERLNRIFSDIFETNITVRDEMSAEDIEEWDSFNHIQIIVACEKEFNLKFKTEDLLSLENVGDFIELIKRESK